ncbi:MAG: PIG-L family deacetylase [Patescibacteria group bacterium]|nr:PIG-L family deacetylase [Patescibacteria group bacterium]
MSSFSCIIPAYNEEGRVGRVVKVVKSYGYVSEVIVVSDGSNDGTVKEAKDSGADKVIELKKNLGKGGAVFMGAQYAQSDFLLLLDADLVNLNHNHLDLLIKPILNDQADMTIGVLADDPNQNIFPMLSGQRVLRKELILENSFLKKSRFQLELILNQLAKEHNQRVLFVNLFGLGHVRKRSKYRFWMALNKYVDAFISYSIFYFKKFWPIGFSILLMYFIFYPNKQTLSDLKLISQPTADDRILVIVAHPDDETIAMGGYLAKAMVNGAKVKVVFITNGEGNLYYAYLREKNIFNKDRFVIEETVRISEAIDALTSLGLSRENIIFIGFPHRYLKRLFLKHRDSKFISPLTHQDHPLVENEYNKNSDYTASNLENIIKKIIVDYQPTKIFTHSAFDKHNDHYAVNQIVRDVLRDINFNSENFYSFLIHYNNFSKPWYLNKNSQLLPPDELVDKEWLLFALNTYLMKAKEEALLNYESQLKSPYLNLFLRSFIRKNELFLIEGN